MKDACQCFYPCVDSVYIDSGLDDVKLLVNGTMTNIIQGRSPESTCPLGFPFLASYCKCFCHHVKSPKPPSEWETTWGEREGTTVLVKPTHEWSNYTVWDRLEPSPLTSYPTWWLAEPRANKTVVDQSHEVLGWLVTWQELIDAHPRHWTLIS